MRNKETLIIQTKDESRFEDIARFRGAYYHYLGADWFVSEWNINHDIAAGHTYTITLIKA